MSIPPKNKIMGRTVRLPSKQREIFDRIFQCGEGYVLDFSDRTMDEWFQEEQESVCAASRERPFIRPALPKFVQLNHLLTRRWPQVQCSWQFPLRKLMKQSK
jgi:hypothetical protein